VLDRGVLEEFLAEVGREGGDRMMDMFMQNTQAAIRGLAKVTSDAVALERFAHSLKSTAGIFGFARLAATAAELETDAARGIYPETAIGSLEAALDDARREIKTA
jgi:HPt (histidine-containing phosphotransfer) domain-containing protein